MNELSKVKNFTCLPESELLANKLLKYPLKLVTKKSKILSELNHSLQYNNKLSLFKGIACFEDLFKTEEEHVFQCELFFRFIKAVAMVENPVTEVVVFKNTHIGQCLKVVPDALIQDYNIQLHFLFRDPRAIYRSQRNSVGSWGKPMAQNPASVIFEWGSLFKTWQSHKTTASSWVMAATYEDLVQNCNEVIGHLLVFLGNPEATNQKTLGGNYHTKIPLKLQHLHENISKPIQTSFRDKWMQELSKKEKTQISRFLGTRMVAMGYQITVKSSSDPIILLSTITLVAKLFKLQIKMHIFGPEIPPSVNE